MIPQLCHKYPVPSSRLQGFAYISFAVAVWSGWVLLGRYSVRGTLTAYDITALRFGVAGLVLLPVLWRKGLSLGPHGWKGSLFLALMMGAPYNTIAIAGMRYASASQASAIINTTMLSLTALISAIALKERLTLLRGAGITLSIAGILCMMEAAPAAGSGGWQGSVLFLVAGSMWACYTVSLRAWQADPLHATAAVCVLSLLLYLPIYLLFIPSHIGHDNAFEALFQAFYQGVINSVLALLCFNRGVRLLGATTASACLPMVCICSTLLAIPLLGETPNVREWLGIALASCGVVLATGIVRGRFTGYGQRR